MTPLEFLNKSKPSSISNELITLKENTESSFAIEKKIFKYLGLNLEKTDSSDPTYLYKVIEGVPHDFMKGLFIEKNGEFFLIQEHHYHLK